MAGAVFSSSSWYRWMANHPPTKVQSNLPRPADDRILVSRCHILSAPNSKPPPETTPGTHEAKPQPFTRAGVHARRAPQERGRAAVCADQGDLPDTSPGFIYMWM